MAENDNAVANVGAENEQHDAGHQADEEMADAPDAFHANASGKNIMRWPKFVPSQHVKALPAFFTLFTTAMTVNQVDQKVWGVILMGALTIEYLNLVMSYLGLPQGSILDPLECTFEAVKEALRTVCAPAAPTDQGYFYDLMSYRAPEDDKCRYRTTMEAMEQIFLKMAEPPTTQTKIFQLCLKVPRDHRSAFQFDNGKPWDTFEAFKLNWMAQSALLESEHQRQSNKKPNRQGSNGHGKSDGDKPGKHGKKPYKRPRQQFNNGGSPNGRDNHNSKDAGPDNSKGPKCQECGQLGHRSFWKDRQGNPMCPKAQKGK